MVSKRRIIIGISVATCMLLLACLLILNRGLTTGHQYVSQTLPELTKDWNQATLRRQLNTSVFSDADIAKISALGKRHLGALTSFTLNRATLSPRDVDGQKRLRLCYAVPANFDKAQTSGVSIAIAHIDGRWQIVEFDVGDPKDLKNNLFKPVHPTAFMSPEELRRYQSSLKATP